MLLVSCYLSKNLLRGTIIQQSDVNTALFTTTSVLMDDAHRHASLGSSLSMHLVLAEENMNNYIPTQHLTL